MHARLLALTVSVFAPVPALAQDTPPPKPAPPVAPAPQPGAQQPELQFKYVPESNWTLQFEPSAWYASPGGDLTLPGTEASGAGGDMGFEELNLDTPRFSPMGELHFRDGDWHLMFSTAHFSADDRGAIAQSAGQIGPVSFAEGDRLLASMEYTTAEMSAGYRFIHRQMAARQAGGFNYVPMVEVLGGLRLHDLSFDVDAPGGHASGDEFFAEPFAGMRFSMDLAEGFAIDVQASLGGFTDGSSRQAVSWDTVIGLQWYPTRNIGVQAGYRQLAMSLASGEDEDEFKWSGALAGLYFGLSLRY